MIVPQEALVRVEEGYIVYVVVNEGGQDLVRTRPVEVGPGQRNEVVVLSGVDPGDRLIVVGQHSVAAGDRVTVVGER